MLSHEDNMLLTQTGPGTPMGKVFRSFWIPVMLSTELPEPDCPPVRLKVLSEYLIAYRITNGKVVIAEEFCPHRNASLYFGRNEENGIRCAFHGWKFDENGRCVDTPNEPPGSKLKEKVCIKVYPTEEKGGIIWTYMGEKDKMPQFPSFEWAEYPEENRFVSKWHQECNYFQGIEANLDSSHVSFLHYGTFGGLGNKNEKIHQLLRAEKAPIFETVTQDYGVTIGAGRRVNHDEIYWRVSQFVAPCWTLIPPTQETGRHAQAWVPIDDVNCMSFAVTWDTSRALTRQEIENLRNGRGIHAKVIQGTFKPYFNKENDYMMNRELQATGHSYTGIPGVSAQDSAVIESTRGIPDRTRERLGMADIGIIQVRKFLMSLARQLRDGGTVPQLDVDRIKKLKAAAGVLKQDENFYEGLKHQME